MRTTKVFLATGLAALCLATCAPLAPAATPTLAAADIAAPRLARSRDYTADARAVEHLAERIVTEAKIPSVAIAVVQGERVLSLKTFGVSDTVSRQPATTDTAYRLASLSKAFAGTLSALLVREGALSWDTRLVDQLPAFRLADVSGAQALVVRDILAHRAGLAHNTYDRDLEADQPYELLAGRLANAPLACRPGECYAYQNIAFSLIGDVVFAVTGDFYSHQVEKRLFHPLGMYGATYGRQALEASPNWARPHVRGRGGWVPVRPKETYYRVPPAAGVNASIHDMAQWLIAQMGHRPDALPPDVLDQVHAPQVATPGELRGSPWRRGRLRDASYALGWRVYDYAGHRLLFHGGAVQGYRSLIGFLPDRDLGIVVLWNSESAAPGGLMPTLLDRALGLPQTDWVQLDRLRPATTRRRHGRR